MLRDCMGKRILSYSLEWLCLHMCLLRQANALRYKSVNSTPTFRNKCFVWFSGLHGDANCKGDA